MALKEVDILAAIPCGRDITLESRSLCPMLTIEAFSLPSCYSALFYRATACTRGGFVTFSLPLKSTLTGRRPTKMVLQKVQGTGCVVPVQYTYQMVLR